MTWYQNLTTHHIVLFYVISSGIFISLSASVLTVATENVDFYGPIFFTGFLLMAFGVVAAIIYFITGAGWGDV